MRRGKALAVVMEQATIKDASGNVVDLEQLRDGLSPGQVEPDVQVDEDGRAFHVHGDGGVHYLDEDEHAH